MLTKEQEDTLELFLGHGARPERERQAICALRDYVRGHKVSSPQHLLHATYVLWPELKQVMRRGPSVPTWEGLKDGAFRLQRIAVKQRDEDWKNENYWRDIFAAGEALIEFCFLLPKPTKPEIYPRWDYVGRCQYCWRLAPAGRISPRHPVRCSIHFDVDSAKGRQARRLQPIVSKYEYEEVENELRRMWMIRTPPLAHRLAVDRVRPDELAWAPGWYSDGDIESWFFFMPHLEKHLAAVNRHPVRDDPSCWVGDLLDDKNPAESEIGLQTKQRVLNLIANDLRLGLFLMMWAEAWLAVANKKSHGGQRVGAGRKRHRGGSSPKTKH